jgi:hypothetical protein
VSKEYDPNQVISMLRNHQLGLGAIVALLFFFGLGMPQALAQETLDRDSFAEEATVDGETDEAGDDSEPTLQSPLNPKKKPRWNPRKDKNTPKFLGLVALLLLWLLARSTNPVSTAGRTERLQRHTPLNANELGHAAFQAALDANLDEYRGLFLSGSEAAKVLGTDGAEAYLNRRSLSALEDALAELAARIPQGSHFATAAVEDDDLCMMTLNLPDRSKATLPLGTVSFVGRVLRLREPPKTT